MIEWIQDHETALTWLAVVSTITFVATLAAVPVFVVRVPADYFLNKATQQKPWDHRSAAVRATLGIGKRILGAILIIIGILMLVLPGQGILTILIGLILVDFPGTYQLERWIVGRPPVYRSINWLRRRAGKTPLEREEKRC